MNEQMPLGLLRRKNFWTSSTLMSRGYTNDCCDELTKYATCLSIINARARMS